MKTIVTAKISAELSLFGTLPGGLISQIENSTPRETAWPIQLRCALRPHRFSPAIGGHPSRLGAGFAPVRGHLLRPAGLYPRDPLPASLLPEKSSPAIAAPGG